MKCPACTRELTVSTIGGIALDVCKGGCAGIWFDAFELERLDEQHEVPGEHVLRIERDPAILVIPSAQRDCPRCDDLKLVPQFYGPARRVEVDVCPGCGGHWVDAGEFEKIRHEKAESEALEDANGVHLTDDVARFLAQWKMGPVKGKGSSQAPDAL
jgi:uncharacterized protein